MVKTVLFLLAGFVFAVSMIRAAHRSGEYNLVQWIIGEPVRE